MKAVTSLDMSADNCENGCLTNLQQMEAISLKTLKYSAVGTCGPSN